MRRPRRRSDCDADATARTRLQDRGPGACRRIFSIRLDRPAHRGDHLNTRSGGVGIIGVIVIVLIVLFVLGKL
jgi:hypothetical protein